VLDGNDAARFPRHLVRDQKIAQTADSHYDSMLRGEALFIVGGQPGEGKTVADLEAALRAEIARIRAEGVSADEVARVKTQLVAAQVYKRDSMMAQAMEIGGFEAAGFHWRDVDKTIEKLRTVTAEEVQAVAKKYFADDSLTVAVLDPQPIDKAAPAKPPTAVRH
jgi:zinc protease